MKKTLLLLSLMLSTTNLFAQTDQPRLSDDLLNQSLELLAKQSDKIHLTGDVHKNENLKPILKELGDYLASGFFQEGNQTRIRNFSAKCDAEKSGAFAKCVLTIQYKPLGETTISYNVGLDTNKKPVFIIENHADVSRGD